MWPRISSEFKKVDPNRRSITATFQFNVKKNGHLMKIISELIFFSKNLKKKRFFFQNKAIDCKNLTIKDGAVENPDAILFIEDDALIACAKRETTILKCIKEKRASVTGDLDLFQRLSDKFPKTH